MNKTQYPLYKNESYDPYGGDINIEVDLSNYVTKTDFKKNIAC